MATFLGRLVASITGPERPDTRTPLGHGPLKGRPSPGRLAGRRLGCASTALAALLAAPGCGNKLPTVEEMEEASRREMAPVLAKHATAAKAKIEALKAVAADADAAPPLKTRQPVAALAVIGSSDPLKAGLLMVTPYWTGAAGVTPPLLQVDCELRLGKLNGAMADGHVYNTQDTVYGIDQQFGLLTGLRHAAMVRVRHYAPPKATTFGTERRFEAGRAAGDVLVYDLDTREKVGGFPFEITRGDKVRAGGKSEEAIQRELSSAFASDFNVMIQSELKAFIGGKPGPAAPGAEDKTSLAQFVRRIELEVTMAHLAAFLKRAEITERGGLTVTLYAESPLVLGGKNGLANPDVKATVEKILGCEAVVKVAKP